MNFDPNNVRTWGGFSPLIIAHDVGRSRDRSTAVVGGNCPYGHSLGLPYIGVGAAEELPQNLSGSARANALATIDRRYECSGLIVADVSTDESYAEILLETFGERVVGLHISRFGNGMTPETRACRHGRLFVYTIGRTYLIDLLENELQSDAVRMIENPQVRKAYGQLAALEREYRQGGVVYTCPPGEHDDLGISLAMLAWAARHPHLVHWLRGLQASRRSRRPREKFNWAAVT
jgi:hypothetical protein